MTTPPALIVNPVYQPTVSLPSWCGQTLTPGPTPLTVNWQFSATVQAANENFYNFNGFPYSTLILPLASFYTYFYSSVLNIDQQTYEKNSYAYDSLFEKYITDYICRYLLTADYVSKGAGSTIANNSYYNPNFLFETATIPRSCTPGIASSINIPFPSANIGINDFSVPGVTSDQINYTRFNNYITAPVGSPKRLNQFKTYFANMGQSEEPGPHSVMRTPQSNPYVYTNSLISFNAPSSSKTLGMNVLTQAASKWVPGEMIPNYEQILQRTLDPLHYILFFLLRLFTQIGKAATNFGNFTQQLQQSLNDAQTYATSIRTFAYSQPTKQSIAQWNSQAATAEAAMSQIQSAYDASSQDTQDLATLVASISELQSTLLTTFTTTLSSAGQQS